MRQQDILFWESQNPPKTIENPQRWGFIIIYGCNSGEKQTLKDRRFIYKNVIGKVMLILQTWGIITKVIGFRKKISGYIEIMHKYRKKYTANISDATNKVLQANLKSCNIYIVNALLIK